MGIIMKLIPDNKPRARGTVTSSSDSYQKNLKRPIENGDDKKDEEKRPLV